VTNRHGGAARKPAPPRRAQRPTAMRRAPLEPATATYAVLTLSLPNVTFFVALRLSTTSFASRTSF